MSDTAAPATMSRFERRLPPWVALAMTPVGAVALAAVEIASKTLVVAVLIWAMNQLRILGRRMRLLTIPDQSLLAKAWNAFDGDGRMKPSPYHDRIVDVMEELVKFTLLTRDLKPPLVNRYSGRLESHRALSQPVNQTKAV